MSTVLRWTGLGKLFSFYRYFAFNVPRVTTFSGVVLLGGLAAIHLYLLLGTAVFPVYLAAYFALLATGALMASAGMVIGRRPALTRAGWALGSLASATSVAMYLLSRTLGLPGLSQLVGRWDYALGTFSLLLAVLFLALHVSVVTGMNVAVPQRRQWHS
ncbi:hypothetical protein [Haloactinomyces albus]|uniref:Membrane protein n=1 Tax=Haloactinomyces albus TaxID=1352928 RepID=A0AAE4CJN7_9ACTN|nr:hypothetical protein [Haloactinomyces albus]MDR7299889.1 putative membrane protein [Haloactinomyces albus]